MPRIKKITAIKSMLLLSMLLFFAVVSSQAQIKIKRSHPLSSNVHLDIASQSPIGSGILNIIAVRVEFQSDSNRFTSGNGTFQPGGLPYLEENEINIDPLPHDKSYFESHLEFAQNYFEQISGGKLSVDYRVLPDIYQLDHNMEFYAPTGQNFTNEKLAMLSQHVWKKVEEQGGFDSSGLDPQKTAFIIFHAGVGRDIELTGTSLDKTPQDLPSIYLSAQALSDLLNEPNFEGFPLNDGNLRITNTLILPRTLSRRGVDVSDTEFVLQLSTNGLICATIGSHLGLPDLFNTETGTSGIGRFGLMDGASIFSYRGLFPPEPSAWEKSYMGWTSPFSIDTDDTSPISLTAASLQQPSGSVARYSISGKEYFLVENRHRDPDNDGAILTIRRPDSTEVQQHFDNQDETFVTQGTDFAELFTPGVLVDVDNFDWSLPGGLDRGADNEPGTSDDRLLNGGMLIWHIDEAIIEQQISRGRVNANPNRRGVDLEEADGAQDIGRPAGGQNADFINGTAFDFWWSGNDASVITSPGDTLSLYENRFGPDTHPNNNSNSGAQTFFEFYDFSDAGPTTSFRVRSTDKKTISALSLPVDTLPNNQSYTPADDLYWDNYPLSLSIYTSQQDSFLVIPTNRTTYALRLNSEQDPFTDFQTGPPQQPFLGQRLVRAEKPETNDINLSAWNWDGSQWLNDWSAVGTSNRGFLSSENGSVLFLDFTNRRFDLSDGSALSDLPNPQQRSSPLGGRRSILSQNEFVLEDSPVNFPVSGASARRLYTGALQLSTNQNLFYLMEDDSFYLIDPEASNSQKLLFTSPGFGWPAMADFDDDHRLDFLFINHEQNRLDAVNANGAFLNSFPLTPPEGSYFTGTPLISDLDGDQSPDLIITVQDSVSMNLFAYNQQGQLKSGFPLYVGTVSTPVNQPIHPVISGKKLYAVSHHGDLKVWGFPRMQNTKWKSRYGNESFNKVTGRISQAEPSPDISTVLVPEETYNWPNPAQDETYIRYQTSGAGSVKIKIITVNGRVVFDEKFDSSGGAPEEQRVSTINWGSGIYLAQITARVNGRESTKLIKIAVVH